MNFYIFRYICLALYLFWTCLGGYRPRRPQNFELQRAKMADEKQLSTLYDMKRDLDHELAELKRKYQESKKIHEKCHLQRTHMQLVTQYIFRTIILLKIKFLI